MAVNVLRRSMWDRTDLRDCPRSIWKKQGLRKSTEEKLRQGRLTDCPGRRTTEKPGLRECQTSKLQYMQFFKCVTRRRCEEKSQLVYGIILGSDKSGWEEHNYNIFIIKPTDALIVQIYFVKKLYMFRAVPLPIIRSSFTVHVALVYVIQVCRQLSSRSICCPYPEPARFSPYPHIPLPEDPS